MKIVYVPEENHIEYVKPDFQGAYEITKSFIKNMTLNVIQVDMIGFQGYNDAKQSFTL